MPKEPKAVRNRNAPIKVYVNETERETIERVAEATQKSPSALMRDLAMGFEPRSVFDKEAIQAMIKLNADQGRLGGLLKLWLTGEKHGEGVSSQEVRQLYEQTQAIQMQLAKIVMSERKKF